ncbi:hypothetical protein [Stutzerimonas zhaodongensis]|uniref:hypothetical protein n=1 Tax=Stutzerimonas zhaodongensis TaxID=1176257 RepID=UPI0021023C53|nr:hypothetical protein [Stutzerimonas zhaodongensis]MCQ2030798.1 hypothetical protein [Stutzerimonas zhaodongensis]
MNMRIPVFMMMVAVSPLALATGTGPTLPEKSREHPLDTREPRQDVIEGASGSQNQPRPATLETPRELPTTEQSPRDSDADMRSEAKKPASNR